MKHIVLSVLCLFILGGCASITVTPTLEITPPSSSESSQVFFDDFSYSAADEMTANGWIVRSGSGWPGVNGATFRPENVSFVDYPDPADNRLLRMTSSTDGSGENTFKHRFVISVNILKAHTRLAYDLAMSLFQE